MEKYARASGENAIKARDAMNPDAYVLGGMAPPSEGISDIEAIGREAYHKEIADHAKLLADVGVDALLPEYIGSVDDGVEAVDACAETGLPVLLALRGINSDGDMRSGETMEDLARALEGHPVDAVLLMCSRPEAITEGLKKLRVAYDGPIGGYANLGYGGVGILGETARERYMNFGHYGPIRVAEVAQEWKDIGAQIIGGCCGTGPEHILMMNLVLRDLERPVAPAG